MYTSGMLTLAALVLLSAARQEPIIPALWLTPQGEILVDGEPMDPKSTNGVSKTRSPIGTGFDFSGDKPGILFPDLTAFKLTRHITIAAWIYARSYAPNGNQSQIFFRGDDRPGLDPYFLCLMKDGTVRFSIENEKGEEVKVQSDFSLNVWTHITASFDMDSGTLTMWRDGIKVDSVHTNERPFFDLVPKEAPGVGIGNVQNNKGPYNEQFDGKIADLRVFDRNLTPEQAGYHWTPAVASGGPQP